LRCPTLLKELV
jgi:hypothetical protein